MILAIKGGNGFVMLEIKAVLCWIHTVFILTVLTWYFEMNLHCCKYESMKDISKTKSRKDCFANCNDVDLLINLKWWFHDHCLPLNCFLQDHAMCLFWTATQIYHIIARAKWNKVETNCRRQIQELYLTDITDQFVLWFLIVNNSVEWNALPEAVLLTSSHSAQKPSLCIHALWKFQ